jgi:hypothetical protein
LRPSTITPTHQAVRQPHPSNDTGSTPFDTAPSVRRDRTIADRPRQRKANQGDDGEGEADQRDARPEPGPDNQRGVSPAMELQPDQERQTEDKRERDGQRDHHGRHLAR